MYLTKFFFLSFVFIIATSFFWDDDEKQLKQHLLKGETAFFAKKYDEAILCYLDALSILESSSWQKVHTDWRAYVDTVLRLSFVYISAGKEEEAEKRLTTLLARKPPEELVGQIKLELARLPGRKSPKEQYGELKAVLSMYPKEHWKKEHTSFFEALEYTMKSEYDLLVHKAKRNQAAGCYKQAIDLYRELITDIEKGFYPKVSKDSFLMKKLRLHLAECYFADHELAEAISLCEENKEIDPEMIYLEALCFKEKQEYEKALSYFQQYFESGKRSDLQHYDHALFEIGLYHYQKKKSDLARHYFSILSQFDKGKKTTSLGSIYLAKLDLEKNRPKEAYELLAEVLRTIAKDDPLITECFYLQGQALFNKGAYKAAKEHYEKALAHNKGSDAIVRSASYQVGLLCIKLLEMKPDEEEKNTLFDQAEKIFKKLTFCENSEEASLALAKLYITFGKTVTEEDKKQLQRLLEDRFKSSSLEFQLKALLLLAEAESNFSKKEFFYSRATDKKLECLAGYSEALMLRGLNFFQEGRLTSPPNKHLLDEACCCFEKAYAGLEGKKNGSLILKMEAKTDFFRGFPERSLAILQGLLQEGNKIDETHEETFYLQGLIAFRLNDHHHAKLAEASFSQIHSFFPDGPYHAKALYMLGSLYFRQKEYEKAKSAFLELVNKHKESECAAESLFWAAESAEKLGEENSEWMVQLYKEYPQSKRAPEAFFRKVPYTLYLEKEPRAIQHLKEFSCLFPNSPLLISVSWLLGRSEKGFEAAEAYFQEGLEAFSLCEKDSHPLHTSHIYFYYRTLLDLAELRLSHEKNLDLAASTLASMKADFDAELHPHACFLKNEMYPPLLEEAEYMLAQVFLKLGKDAKAQECFTSMLKHYEEAKTSKGTFLSHVWREQGKLAMKVGNYETALKCFEIASECGLGYLSDDQTLALWIMQSNCHKAKGEYGQAMRLLSKVVNADAASVHRLEAMSLRAELYEMQKRPELAIRQLEAAARKGSLEAQEKLKVKYGL